MAAAMNGIAAHGGLDPLWRHVHVLYRLLPPGDPAVGADGPRASIYVMTHDSIGLGEDGPTHQPVEHMAALRAIPHLLVFRPADSIETAECWALAMKHRDDAVDPGPDPPGPAAAAHRRRRRATNRRRGAYVLAEASGGERQVTLLATGSEVAIAMDARELLAKDGVRAAVVSMPCWELFEQQPAEYRKAVLGTAPRVGGRGGGSARLGPLARRAFGVCRHGRLRRLRADRGALPAFRHHRREGCGSGPLAFKLTGGFAEEEARWRYGLRSTGSAASAGWSCARPWSTPARSSRSSASTISARSRPTRTC